MSWREHLRPEIYGLTAYRTFDYATAPPDLVRLDANESSIPEDAEDRAALAEALADVAVHRYPEVSGRPLREALAARWGVAPEQVILGNGSDEIIAILITAFGGGRGGQGAKVLFPTPTFGEYEGIALTHGVRPVAVPLDAEFQLDEAALATAIRREGPALTFFATPNNPTGNRFDAAVMERLAQASDGVTVVDEAYADFGGGTMVDRVGHVPGLCVMRTLSKIGMAALRIGALVAPADLAHELDKVRLPYNVNTASQALAIAILRRADRLSEKVARGAAARRALEAGLRELPGLTVYPSDSNFVLVRTPGDAKGVWERLLERKILVRNLSRPGPLQNCLRITAGTPEENSKCLEALRAVLR
ncbi:MAG TPA: histidinol-phosphate transaminase [Anaeromyxobacteraceae bacterium]|nr:histidinol-phosphate transaminase [Anaeromyxobacteraceae bacterium]